MFLLLTYLWAIRRNILTQFARMKPTLPTRLLRSHAKNKKMQERMTISPLYLSSCAEFIAANTYASVTPLIPYKIFKSKEQLFIDEEISKKKKGYHEPDSQAMRSH